MREVGTANCIGHSLHAKCGFVLPEGLVTIWSLLQCVMQSAVLGNDNPHIQQTGCFSTRQWLGVKLELRFRFWSPIVPLSLSISRTFFTSPLLSGTSFCGPLFWPQAIRCLNPYLFTLHCTWLFDKRASSFIRWFKANSLDMLVSVELNAMDWPYALFELWSSFEFEHSSVCVWLPLECTTFCLNDAIVNTSLSFVPLSGSSLDETAASKIPASSSTLLLNVDDRCAVLEHVWRLDWLFISSPDEIKESSEREASEVLVPVALVSRTVWTWYL